MIDQFAMDQDFVVDAAASLGCQPNLSTLRCNGAVVFSLHATKVLGGGEGGIVVFGSPDRAREVRSWSNFGFTGNRLASRSGTNAKMSESTAAYCLAALDDWDNERESWLNSRREVVALSKRLNLNTWLLSEDVVSPYWLILCDNANEQLALSECLSENGVETRCWWPSPIHEMDAFVGCGKSAIPPESTSRNLASRVVGLPFFRNIDKKSIEHIEESLRMFTLN
jgi:dTDP-4-amino-4,6-dideoxygalactose transaminase